MIRRKPCILKEIKIDAKQPAATAITDQPPARAVIINGVRLSDEQVQALEQQYRVPIQDGAYWYDRFTGAWGVQDGPTVGFIHAGMNLGGPLRADASKGNTGVWINGRQLHIQDVLGLQRIVPYVLPGRYMTKFIYAILLACYGVSLAVAQNAETHLQKLTGWNIEYRPPQGWRVQQTLGRLHVLSAGSPSEIIYLAPGMYSNANEALADLYRFVQAMGTNGYPIAPPAPVKFAGLNGTAASYRLQDPTRGVLQSHFIALFTPHGTGVNMLAVSTPERFPDMKATLEQIAATVKGQAPQFNQQMAAALAGTWVYYAGRNSSNIANSGSSSSSYQETVVFDGRGNFRWSSSSHVSVDSPVTGGGYSGGASNFGQNSDQGTYAVIGNSLIIKGSLGHLVFDFELRGGALIAAGKTYVRE